MLVTFPHLGYLHVGLEAALANIGIQAVVPPRPNKKALTKARQIAPESACLPFCIVLGSMIEGLENGADTILMVGGCGPCRVGYFGPLAKNILQENDYKFEMVLIEGNQIIANLRRFKEYGNVSWLRIYDALRLGWRYLLIAEEFDDITRKLQPCTDKKELKKCLEKWRGIIFSLKDQEDVKLALLYAREELANLPRVKVQPKMKIGVVGDIYTMLEPYANYHIIEWLGDQGVEVYQDIKLSQWYEANIFPWKNKKYTKELLVKAKSLLTSSVGGFGLESVAHSCAWVDGDVDGVLQIYPMGCMPETVARGILPNINKPFMSVIVDEHDSSTGVFTRLEAFLDMINRQKQESVASSPSKSYNG